MPPIGNRQGFCFEITTMLVEGAATTGLDTDYFMMTPSLANCVYIQCILWV